MASRPARQSTALLRLEQLERRDLMAGNVGLAGVGQATTFCGPLPLSQVVVSPSAAEHVDSGLGNITAEVVNGVLIIRGDGLGNRFSIYGNGDGGGRTVIQVNSGHYYEDRLQEEQVFSIVPGLTLINGQQLNNRDTQTISFKGVTAIDIDLGDGDDFLEIFAVKTPHLTIRTGDGNDEVILKGMMPYRMAHFSVWQEYPRIEGPMGDVHAAPQPLRVDGDLFIDTGAGADRLSPFAAVEGDATVRLGTGDNSYIEVPYQLNQIWPEKDPVTGQYPAPERVIGKLTASGELSIDWGADQVTTPAEFGENVLISPVTTSPIFRPYPLQDVSVQATGVSLRDWYYSNVVMGPEPLQ